MHESHRQLWIDSRVKFETSYTKSTRLGYRNIRSDLIKLWVRNHILRISLIAFGIYRRGQQNAINLSLKPIDLHFDNLPESFDGYKILHLTDLHLDIHPLLTPTLVRALSGLEVDLCVLTGDYRAHIKGPHDQIITPLSKIIDCISATDGIYATLGNHDEHSMAVGFEKIGLNVLANETISLRRNQNKIILTGIDDVFWYYTPMAENTLTSVPVGFAIALVHSAEMAEIAAKAGYSLYLCGHTHGGQI